MYFICIFLKGRSDTPLNKVANYFQAFVSNTYNKRTLTHTLRDTRRTLDYCNCSLFNTDNPQFTCIIEFKRHSEY